MTLGGHFDNAVARFLGAAASRGGPTSLLGLPETGFGELDILEARARQMRLVDEHPESFTPAADEVRLALHAATAQLLNPSVRERLRRGTIEDRRRAAMLGLENDVVLTLGMFGGWSRKSIPRLVALAHARGLQTQDVAKAVANIATRRSPRKAGGPTPTRSDSGGAIVAMEVPPRLPTSWVIAGVGLLSVAISGLVLALALSHSSPNLPSSPGGLPGGGGRSDALVLGPREESKSTTPTVAPALPETPPAQLLEVLQRAIAGAATDPAASSRLGVEAVRGLGGHWLELSSPVRTRAQDLVFELMYRIGGSSADAPRLLDAIGEGSTRLRAGEGPLTQQDVIRATWSIGMLTRLRRESDLSAQSQVRIERWLATALQTARPAQLSFVDGGMTALQVMAEPVSSPQGLTTDGWKAWARAASALTETDPARRGQLLALGAAQLLSGGADEADRTGQHESIGAVITAMPWKLSPDTRAWFVRQFDNRDVSTSALSAATQAVVSQTDAEGLDPTMVLSSMASDLDRRALRDRYIEAWQLEDAGSDVEVLERLGKALAELEPGLQAGASAETLLRTATSLARLNAAAAARWQGDDAGSLQLIGDMKRVGAGNRRAADSSLDASNDGNWGERYLLQNMNIDKRLELLAELASSSRAQLGPVDAEVLVGEAIRGTPRAIRESARPIVETFGSSPAVVNALLEEAPRLPPIQTVSDLIVSITVSPLPDRNSPSWRAAVRRALVQRMLELLAADGEDADIDQIAALFDDAYREQTLIARVASASGEVTTPPAERSAALLRARWTRLGERLIPSSAFGWTLEDIERRRAGRASLARGIVQRFLVEQTALAETMGYVVAAERPGMGASVRQVLDELDAAMQRSTHVFHQIALVERAMVDLWQMRLGLDVTKGDG